MTKSEWRAVFGRLVKLWDLAANETAIERPGEGFEATMLAKIRNHLGREAETGEPPAEQTVNRELLQFAIQFEHAIDHQDLPSPASPMHARLRELITRAEKGKP